MIALDTSLLARLLLRDDARQYARVRRLLAQEQDFTAPATVMLELVWVLEVNDCSPQDIVRGIRLLLDLPNFKPQQSDALRQALQWYAQGIDFSDALRLAQSGASEHLATFDKAFARKAGKLGAVPPVVAV